MVPRNRLLLWTALVVLPFSVLAVTSRAGFFSAAIAIGAFFLLVLVDAIRGARSLRGFQLAPPSLVRLQKNRPGEIELTVRMQPALSRLLRIGLALPASLETAETDRLVHLPADSASARVAWPCTPTKRGQFWLRGAALETASQLGFWAFRRQQKLETEIRVYPNLHEERRQVAALFLRHGRLGVHAQRHAGQGREFEKLREYMAGDILSEIHWKASARRGSLVTKVFQVERTHEVYVVVDTSRLSARPCYPDKESVSAMERYVTAALILAFAAEQQGDQFGLITFSDRVHSFVRARSGPSHLDACRDRLYALQPSDVSPDFEELFALVRLRLRKRALLVVLTALDDPVLSESFVKASSLVSRQHLLLVNMLQPPGVGPLFSSTQSPGDIEGIYQALGGHLQWQKLRELQKVLQYRGVRLSFLDPATLSSDLLSQHSDARARSLV